MVETLIRYAVRCEDGELVDYYDYKHEARQYAMKLKQDYPNERFVITEQEYYYAGQDEDGCSMYDVASEDELEVI